MTRKLSHLVHTLHSNDARRGSQGRGNLFFFMHGVGVSYGDKYMFGATGKVLFGEVAALTPPY